MESDNTTNISFDNSKDIIKPISKTVVHRICSGQVILTLSIAVKELVENSIDAGSTIIDITLKEFGADVIEVSDNGSGVVSDNFQALTLKHYTSKIQEFEELKSLSTLGFRGEALSSLCALANLSVATKHVNSENAMKICYDQNGIITKKSLTARQNGTTITLENLFVTLPVRRKEFMKNLKREFNKMCQILYGYCLVSKGIKFTCTNINKGAKNTIMATHGLSTVRENIISIFGTKQISSLIDIEISAPNEAISNEFNIKVEHEFPFSWEFLISSVTHGSGRSTTDRQFYFINKRPVEPTKIMKLVNEIYKQFNSNQYPFVYCNITTKDSLVDVNVTPDKRQIFLENEKHLLATIKSSLLESFKVFPSKLNLQNVDTSQTIINILKSKSKSLKRSITETGPQRSLLESFRKKTKSDGCVGENVTPNVLFNVEHFNSLVKGENNVKTILNTEENLSCKLMENRSYLKTEPSIKNIGNLKNNDLDFKKTTDEVIKNINEDIEDVNISIDTSTKKSLGRPHLILTTSLKSIQEGLKNKQESASADLLKVKFRATICQENNKLAEKELQKQLSKEDFRKMSILGQFNRGFIIAKLENDLFIIDQHATDEKYNFEQLQATTVLKNQNLVNPKPLELTAGNESLLIENENIFNKNGFAFKIDHEAPCTKKVSLTAIPVSQSCVFGKDDIDEMLFMLQDSSQTMCRPSRVRAMFASRACRKSVMIGKALSTNDMQKLVEHMSEIDQPWNCPHGRPTIRHLINIDLLEK